MTGWKIFIKNKTCKITQKIVKSNKKFKKHVLIEKYNGLDDAFSKGVPRKEIFSGAVEDYKNKRNN